MSFFSCHKPLLLNACVVMSFLTTGCTAIEETVRGSVIMAKEKMGMQTAMAAPAPAPRAAQSTEAMLDAEIETPKFTNVWRGMDELVTDYEDVLSGEDKSWFDRRTKSLTNSALKLIASKAGMESYEKILDLQKKIADKNKKKNDLQAGRLGYPVTSSNPFAMTREKCDKKIQELQGDVKECELEINRQSKLLLADLNRHGQVMDEKHLNYLLNAAGGDDVMQMMNLAIILKQVQYAIGKQIKADPQFNGAQLQRYVGIQLVLLLAEANRQEAQALRANAQDGASYLDQNLKLSENTITIAKQYRIALQEMAKSLESSRAKVDRNVAVTRNTFKTVTTGASLLKLIQESSQDYSELISFNPPLLETIYSDQMMEAFQQVSAQLKN